MLPFVHSELPFMHRGIEKYKDFVIFKVYYYILSILRTYNILIYSFNEIHSNDIFIMCMDFIKGFFNSCVVQSVVRHQ